MSGNFSLLPADIWHERLFNGAWVPSPLSPLNVIEPATGNSLGRIGMADANIVAASNQAARLAQAKWIGLPYDERAEVLRRAAQIAESHFEEIVGWMPTRGIYLMNSLSARTIARIRQTGSQLLASGCAACLSACFNHLHPGIVYGAGWQMR